MQRSAPSNPIESIERFAVSTGAQNYPATLVVAVSVAVLGAQVGDLINAYPAVADPPALGLVIGQCICAVAGTVIMSVANVTIAAINAETFSVDFNINKRGPLPG